MATMAEIANRAQEIFDKMFTVADILKGDALAMHKETWEMARKELEDAENNVEEVKVGSTDYYKMLKEVRIRKDYIRDSSLTVDELNDEWVELCAIENSLYKLIKIQRVTEND